MANEIMFNDKNDCSENGSQVGNTLDGSQDYVIFCKNDDEGIGNDDVRSMKLCNFTVTGTVIIVTDDPGGSLTDDDYAIVTVNDTFTDCICVDTFERTHDYGSNGEVTCEYHKIAGGNLDGKISNIKIEGGS